MGFYKAKKTLAALIEERPALLGALVLPAGIDATTLNPIIEKELGELDTIFDDADSAAVYLAVWSDAHLIAWTRMLAALTAEYNPISNYDRTDTESESVGRERSDSRESSGTSSFAGTTGNSGNDVVKSDRQGFNSAEYSPVDKVTTEHGLSQQSASATTTQGSESGSGNESETRAKTLRSSGNIGVTTNQQMIEAEIAMRSKWTIYGIIVEDFKRELCVGVW
jgi:hypothetical protein